MAIKWAAELSHVREVTLLGSADLGFWRNKLASRNLVPIEDNGNARILNITAEGKFHGIRFREINFSVIVSPPNTSLVGSNAAYLLGAFNSCRFFAFCERVFFSTPYQHGDVELSVEVPASVGLSKDGERVFRAQMQDSGSSRMPSQPPHMDWEGPIFLPPVKGGREKLFFARIKGSAVAIPFESGIDDLMIKPSSGVQLLQDLIDSQFTPTDWIIRADGSHAKSKTYNRGDYDR